jgi:hypothetical protein
MPAQKRKVCAFCQRNDQKISKEHVIPAWILDLYAHDMQSTITMKDNGRITNSWKANKRSGLTINDICKPCNHGWMEQIEKTANPILEPMILGHKTILNQDKAIILMTWIYKTAMTFDLVRPNIHDSYFSAKERKLFAENKPPLPRQIFARLARIDPPSPGFKLFKGIVRPDDKTRPTMNFNKFYLSTMSIAHVAFQVLTFRTDKPTIDTSSVQDWHGRTIQFWPLTVREVEWPPAVSIGPHEFNGLNERWLASR